MQNKNNRPLRSMDIGGARQNHRYQQTDARPSRPFRDIQRPAASLDGLRRAQPVESLLKLTPQQPAAMTVPEVASTPKHQTTVIANAIPETKKAAKPQTIKVKFAGVMVVAMFIVTSYVSLTTLKTTVEAKEVVTQASQESSASGQFAADETDVPADAFSGYSVAPHYPRFISIEKLSMKARVLPLSVDTKGAIETPKNIHDAGWYSGSVLPGSAGVTFINAHASGVTRQGLFAYLDTLEPDDVIHVETGNGTKYSYKVRDKQVMAVADIDMEKVLAPTNPQENRLDLVLMTCTGAWNGTQQTYDKRVMIYATQQ